MSDIVAEKVTLTYAGPRGQALTAVAGLSLAVEAGKIAAIIGPSGAGKSTFLAAVAGIMPVAAGRLEVGGEPPTLGCAGLMPQKDLLLPWRSALDNAAMGLVFSGSSWAAARARARPYLEQFGLGGFLQSLPHQLSGGMRQRVAFLRTALASREVLLLDEPFGALDAITRASLHRWFLELWASFGQTVLLITHDVDEALYLSDVVFVVSDRPARVTRTLEVPLGRPRGTRALADPQVAALKADLLDQLVEGAPP